jgi:hypothetical protein
MKPVADARVARLVLHDGVAERAIGDDQASRVAGLGGHAEPAQHRCHQGRREPFSRGEDLVHGARAALAQHRDPRKQPFELAQDLAD